MKIISITTQGLSIIGLTEGGNLMEWHSKLNKWVWYKND